MEILNVLATKLSSITSLSVRNILNLLENCHNKIFQSFKSINLVKPIYFTKLTLFEQQLKTYSPFTLISFGLVLLFLIYLFKKIFRLFKNIIVYLINIKHNLTVLYCKLPGPKAKLVEVRKQVKESYQNSFKSNKFKKIEFHDNKQDYTKILAKMEQNISFDITKAKCGKLTGSVYCDNDRVKYIANEAAKMFLYENLLHPDLYSYGRFIESELIKIGVDLFNGGEDACGMTTGGGTMSILNAIYAYAARGRRNGIENPELIVPTSAHAAFTKACEMFRIKLIRIPLNKTDYKVNLRLVERNITRNTIALVGSFPNFPHGVFDDIESLSKLALKYKLPLHVDCCLGGFLVAFYERAGITTLPRFDFRLPGVTSISADLHKYGLCPKGISLLLFSKHEYRKHIYFVDPHWQGGIYATPSFEGSRTAGLIAGSYAVLTSMGKEFYANNAKQIHDAVVKVKEFIRKECDLIEVIGDPMICGVSFKGKYIPHFFELMEHKGYHSNYLYEPEAFGYIFTSANVVNVDQFIKDLKEIHDKIKREKPVNVSDKTKLYGMSIALPFNVAQNALDVLCDAILD